MELGPDEPEESERCPPEQLAWAMEQYRRDVRARLGVTEDMLVQAERLDRSSTEGNELVALLERVATYLRDSESSADALIASLASRGRETAVTTRVVRRQHGGVQRRQ